ncbi:hypothetical protein Vadar_011523 [Vaccinium darrowii]|uniref:Uncharacterized protein n=1 Tax=Vaccinium darrowii TaxID=229202 RepID=A0ACB7ZJC5_9ERIC|nr:hypothetical protein Vadar_011523 [Vaccinium darrowii]
MDPLFLSLYVANFTADGMWWYNLNVLHGKCLDMATSGNIWTGSMLGTICRPVLHTRVSKMAKIGREKELEDSLQRLRGKSANIYSEMTEIRDYTKTFEQLSKTSILNLFERRYAHALTIGVGTMLLQQFGGSNGILFYASAIFEAAGTCVRFILTPPLLAPPCLPEIAQLPAAHGLPETATRPSITQVYVRRSSAVATPVAPSDTASVPTPSPPASPDPTLDLPIAHRKGCSVSVGTTAMAIIQIPFSALSVFLVDKFGRRPLLMVSAAGTCLGNILAGLGFLFQGFHYSTELSALLVLCGILVYSASFSAGMNATPYVLVSEIFPINIRGSAGSLAILANWLSSWIVSYSFNFLLDWSPPGVFFMFAAICGSTILFVAKFVPETKGQSLEQIQASMTHMLQ